MLRSNFQNAAFRGEKATVAAIDGLENLIRQQAAFHACHYAENRAALMSALTEPDPVPHAALIYKPALSADPVGYIFYTFAWNLDAGRTAYLEDICTHENFRNGHGIGDFGMKLIAHTAQDNQCAKVNWSVMEQNAFAIGFYQRRQGHIAPKNTYDLDNMLTAPLPANSDYAAAPVTANDPAVPAIVKDAVNDSHAGFFAVRDKSGDAVALVMANASYSSFRCVTGLQVEPVKFLKPLNDAEKNGVLSTAFNAVRDFALQKNYTGHIYSSADANCAVSNAFLAANGGGRLRMNNDPSSVFANMYLELQPHAPTSP